MKRILFNIIFLSTSCTGDNNELYLPCMNMIETQIKQRGIKDQAILDAMSKINRHEFVQENFERLAYSCLLYTSPSPRDRTRSRMPSSA